MSQVIHEDDKKVDIEHLDVASTKGIEYGTPSEVASEKNLEYGSVKVIEHDASYILEAEEAVHAQKSQTLLSALSQYKPAIMWSVILSSSIIMESYDMTLLGQFYAQPSFVERYGQLTEAGRYEVPAKWQISLGVASQVGTILGLQITGIASERWGYRVTMLIAMVCLTGFLFIQFFAVNLTMLLIAYLLMGFPWGTFQTMTISYASEVMPVRLRQYLTTYVNLCWVLGQITASGVTRAFVNNPTQWAYRIPFAIQWVWVLPIGLGILFAPESPWWLTRKGKFAQAENSLMRLTSKGAGFTREDARKQVALMEHTNQLEKEQEAGVQFWHCFKGTNLRRTHIVCMVFVVHATGGGSLMGNATYFLKQAGLSSETASSLNLGMFGIGAVGTIASWWVMQVAGRRTIYVWGQTAMATLMLTIGILGSVKSSVAINYAIGALLIVFTGVFDISVGPVCYSLVAEMSSTRLRAKSVILARNFYNLASLVTGIVSPYMLNSGEWNLKAKSAYVWFVCGVIATTWAYFQLPEPKGRTYGELDILFERKVPARLFSKTVVDEFDVKEHQAAARAAAAKTVKVEKD